MRDAAWLPVLVVLTSWLARGSGERVLGEETDEFDFDGLPGAQHEFKIEIKAGATECFYQHIVAGGKLHVSFEVMSGGDGKVGMSVLTPTRRQLFAKVDPHVRGKRSRAAIETGPYAICLDNTMSMMASKLVYVYLVTYVEAEWAKYRHEIEEVNLAVSNFSASINNVQSNIADSKVYQAQTRMHVVKDWYLLKNNNRHVQRWSIFQCVVILVCSCTQVYVLRRLFRTTNVTRSMKPRA